MFSVTEAEAAEIHTVFLEDGELSAGIALRRTFPGIDDPVKARLLAREIAGWKPPVPQPTAGVVVKLRLPTAVRPGPTAPP